MEKDSEPLKYFGPDSVKLIEEIRNVHKEHGLVKFKHVFPQLDRRRGVYVDKAITESMLRTVFEGSGHGKIGGILGAAAKEAPTLLGTNKIPKFTLHKFRDTVGSNMTTEEGQTALGHKNAQTTEEHYKQILKKELAINSDAREATITSIMNNKGR